MNKLKFAHHRVHDHRSSDICRAIEEMSLQQGGISFPFTIDISNQRGNHAIPYKRHHYGTETEIKALKLVLKTPNANQKTYLFHGECRCILTPLSLGAEQIMFQGEHMTENDELMLETGVMNMLGLSRAKTKMKEIGIVDTLMEVKEKTTDKLFTRVANAANRVINNIFGRNRK